MFALVDLLSVRRCDGPGGPAPAFAALPCPAAAKALAGGGGACAAAGGTCVVTHDGYYLLSYAAVGLGAALYVWLSAQPDAPGGAAAGGLARQVAHALARARPSLRSQGQPLPAAMRLWACRTRLEALPLEAWRAKSRLQ